MAHSYDGDPYSLEQSLLMYTELTSNNADRPLVPYSSVDRFPSQLAAIATVLGLAFSGLVAMRSCDRPSVDHGTTAPQRNPVSTAVPTVGNMGNHSVR